LLIGGGKGWFEIVRISNNLELVEVIQSKRFESVDHVLNMQLTTTPYQVVVCSYTGVHFVKIELLDESLEMNLVL
jgi:hypothetical protein